MAYTKGTVLRTAFDTYRIQSKRGEGGSGEVFDVLDSGKPVSGPATRALPQLGLDIDAHGFLIARGDYVDPVGPDSWWRPA